MAQLICVKGKIVDLKKNNLPWLPDTLMIIDENGENYGFETDVCEISGNELIVGSKYVDRYDLNKIHEIRGVKVNNGSSTSILLRVIKELQ